MKVQRSLSAIHRMKILILLLLVDAIVAFACNWWTASPELSLQVKEAVEDSVMWIDMQLNDVTWHYELWRGMARHGMTWHDATWRDMAWRDMAWRDMAWHIHRGQILCTLYSGTPSMLTKSFQKPYLGWPEAVERYKNDFRGRRFWISKVLGMHIDEKW